MINRLAVVLAIVCLVSCKTNKAGLAESKDVDATTEKTSVLCARNRRISLRDCQPGTPFAEVTCDNARCRSTSPDVDEDAFRRSASSIETGTYEKSASGAQVLRDALASDPENRQLQTWLANMNFVLNLPNMLNSPISQASLEFKLLVNAFSSALASDQGKCEEKCRSEKNLCLRLGRGETCGPEYNFCLSKCPAQPGETRPSVPQPASLNPALCKTPPDESASSAPFIPCRGQAPNAECRDERSILWGHCKPIDSMPALCLCDDASP